MLIPRHHAQQLCPRCGRLPAYLASVCPSCGMPLALPWPDQRSGPNPWGASPPFVVVPPPPNFTPLIVELFLNLVGIYGVGWLLLGNLAGGLVLLIASLLLWPVVALIGIFTLGLGLICLGPVVIVAMVSNAVMLQQAIKRKACQSR